MKLNRSHLVEIISGRTGLNKKDVDLAIATLVDVIRDSLHAGDTVTLRFLGSFRKRVVKARTFMSGLTGKEVKVEPRDTIRFVASENF